MTNQEQLATVTPEEWLIKVDWLFHVYGKRWDNSYLAIKDWLAEEAMADDRQGDENDHR